MMKFTVVEKKPFGTWQFDKISVSVNFTHQKFKFCKIAQNILTHSYLAILLLTPSKVERKFVLNYTYTASWNEFK